MTTVTFDTDAAIQTLVDRGIKFEEARALVRVVVDSQRDLATKRDFEEFRQATKRDLTDLKNDMTIRVGLMLIGAIGLAQGLNKWL